jgi:ABC-type amino acid transport system permease subunit
VLLLLIYLGLSLVISAVVNLANRRLAIVER